MSYDKQKEIMEISTGFLRFLPMIGLQEKFQRRVMRAVKGQ